MTKARVITRERVEIIQVEFEVEIPEDFDPAGDPEELLYASGVPENIAETIAYATVKDVSTTGFILNGIMKFTVIFEKSI